MKLILVTFLALFLTGCASRVQKDEPPTMVSMQVVDRNGFTETISAKDRLTTYDKIDFSSAQPYKKVLRIFSRDEKGKSSSKITSYHDNGQLFQYLEIVDGRAHGLYREWHPNGKMSVEAQVIEGMPDITDVAKASWVFNDKSRVWSENGTLLAEIIYDHGSLESTSTYYHANGKIWKTVPYHRNEIEGAFIEYDDEGRLKQTCLFSQGKRQGASEGFWKDGSFYYQENYNQGLLQTGRYTSPKGELIAEVNEGKGSVAQFQDETLYSLTEYKEGLPEGLVQIFAPDSTLVNSYHLKDGQKNGEEIQYYPLKLTEGKLQPKLSMDWKEDALQGVVKTWYQNGSLESQKEMDKNKKQGLSFAWYPTGSLMLMEVYEHDKLLKGTYFEKGDKNPISKVEDGSGTATLFTPQGRFLKKISYEKGKPLLD